MFLFQIPVCVSYSEQVTCIVNISNFTLNTSQNHKMLTECVYMTLHTCSHAIDFYTIE